MARPTACRLCGRSLARHGDSRRAYCKRCTARVDREIAGAQRVVCRECGKRFSTRTRSVKYCSDACRVDGKRRLNTESQRRYMSDPEKRAMSLARTRTSSAARRARTQGKRRPRAGRRAAARIPRGAKSPEPSECRLCGRSFAQYGPSRTHYCRRCRNRIDRKIGTVLAVDCMECGRGFSTKSSIAKYCSEACRIAARRRRCRGMSRRSTADPEEYARMLARQRAWQAANRNRGGR